MHVICIICTELLGPDQDIVVTKCGHSFHNTCILSWLNTSKTCATCRQPISSLIKVYFERSDDSKILDLHNDLITENSSLTKELEELKKLQRSKDAELRETSSKLLVANDNMKSMERIKQMDDMALAGFRAIKEESEREIIKLKEQINSVTLDLLAEKQLRRIHQTTLNKFDPKNADYDTSSILNDESLTKRQEASTASAGDSSKNYIITPFWKLSCEASGTKKEAPNDGKLKQRPYVVPSKIYKADTPMHALMHDNLVKPMPRYMRNKCVSFTLKDLSESRASEAKANSNASKYDAVKTRHRFAENSYPLNRGRFTSDQQPSSSSLTQNRNLFKFGESSTNNNTAAVASSSGINFNFKENTNAQDGFKLLNTQSDGVPPTQNSAASSTTASTSSTFDLQKTSTPKTSDR